MTVLDASAVLTLIHDEQGADAVAAALPGAWLGTVNLAEVVGKLVDVGVDASQLRELLTTAGLALAVRSADAELLTADRAWAELDLPIHVRLLS